MSDRELLEMAGKALGSNETWTDIDGNRYSGDPEKLWNPLNDDGDALRLAVAIPGLNMQWVIAGAWQYAESYSTRMKYVRLAIVQLAAEVGRSMP